MRSFDPNDAWKQIKDERITTTLLVPAMLQFMLGVYGAGTTRRLHAALGDEWRHRPVPLKLMRRNRTSRWVSRSHQVYGLTETCGPACLMTP